MAGDALAARITAVAAICAATGSLFAGIQASRIVEQQARADILKRRIDVCIEYTRNSAKVAGTLKMFGGTAALVGAAKGEERLDHLIDVNNSASKAIEDLRTSTHSLVVLFPEAAGKQIVCEEQEDARHNQASCAVRRAEKITSRIVREVYAASPTYVISDEVRDDIRREVAEMGELASQPAEACARDIGRKLR